MDALLICQHAVWYGDIFIPLSVRGELTFRMGKNVTVVKCQPGCSGWPLFIFCDASPTIVSFKIGQSYQDAIVYSFIVAFLIRDAFKVSDVYMDGFERETT